MFENFDLGGLLNDLGGGLVDNLFGPKQSTPVYDQSGRVVGGTVTATPAQPIIIQGSPADQSGLIGKYWYVLALPFAIIMYLIIKK